MATDTEIEEAWVQGWVQAYHDVWDIFAIANADEALAAAEQRAATMEAALATLLDHLPSDEVLSESWQGDMYWEDIFALAQIVPIYRAALAAPATQPDERAAEAHHARIAQVGAAVAAQCAAKEEA